jgi:hypothetical protein
VERSSCDQVEGTISALLEETLGKSLIPQPVSESRLELMILQIQSRSANHSAVVVGCRNYIVYSLIFAGSCTHGNELQRLHMFSICFAVFSPLICAIKNVHELCVYSDIVTLYDIFNCFHNTS